MKATYALTANKVKVRQQVDRDETLAMLARKYFQSRQPATLEDFVWWSGLNVSDCRRGIELLGDYLHTESETMVAGTSLRGGTTKQSRSRSFYLTSDCRTRGFRKGKYLLIPPYDEYLISYKSRDIVLSPDYKHKAHNNSGIFQPIIAHDGVICGNWTPFKDDLQAAFFIGEHEADIQEEWTRYKKFQTT